MLGSRKWCRGARGRRLLATGVAIATLIAPITPGLATATPASADTVVNGCTIVANPTPTNFTNCPGAELSSANLTGVNLSFANLVGAHFVECFFQQFPLPGYCVSANLTGANLTDANLSHASIFTLILAPFGRSVSGAANLSHATLSGANLSGADLSFVSLTGANLTGADLTGAALGAADLTNANLTNANLTGMSSCDRFGFGICFPPTFTAANLTGANFTGTALVPSNQRVAATSAAGAVVTWPTPASAPGATPGTCTPPSESTFPLGVTTVTCQVRDDFGDVATGIFTVTVGTPTTTTLSSSINPSQVGRQVTYTATISPTPTGGSVYFTDNGLVIFPECSLVPLSGPTAICSTRPGSPGVNNIVANYTGSDTFAASSSPTLTQVVTQTPCKTFVGCNVAGLNLSLANLVGSNLKGANLKGANLTGTNLSGANLKGANLSGALLGGTNLSEADLTGANLSGVVWLDTTCPDGTNSNNDGGTCVGHGV